MRAHLGGGRGGGHRAHSGRLRRQRRARLRGAGPRRRRVRRPGERRRVRRSRHRLSVRPVAGRRPAAPKFPGHDQLLTQLAAELRAEAPASSWADDVEARARQRARRRAFAPSRRRAAGRRPHAAGRPGEVRLAPRRSSRAAGSGVVSRQIGGWTVAADSTPLRSTRSRTRPATLATDDAFQDANGAPRRRLARPRLRQRRRAQQLLGSLPGQSQVTSTRRRGSGPRRAAAEIEPQAFQEAAADVVPSTAASRSRPSHARRRRRDHPPAISARADADPAVHGPPRRRDPAGALFVADFQVRQGEFELADPRSCRSRCSSCCRRRRSSPASCDSILGGETAIYVRPSLPVPEVTLVTQPADTAGRRRRARLASSRALQGAAAVAAGPLGALGNSVQVYHARARRRARRLDLRSRHRRLPRGRPEALVRPDLRRGPCRRPELPAADDGLPLRRPQG